MNKKTDLRPPNCIAVPSDWILFTGLTPALIKGLKWVLKARSKDSARNHLLHLHTNDGQTFYCADGYVVNKLTLKKNVSYFAELNGEYDVRHITPLLALQRMADSKAEKFEYVLYAHNNQGFGSKMEGGVYLKNSVLAVAINPILLKRAMADIPYLATTFTFYGHDRPILLHAEDDNFIYDSAVMPMHSDGVTALGMLSAEQSLFYKVETEKENEN